MSGKPVHIVDEHYEKERKQESFEYEPYVAPFRPYGEPCGCEVCDFSVVDLLPGRTIVFDNIEHKGTRCIWHRGVRIGNKRHGVTLYASDDFRVWVESKNKTLRRDTKATKTLRNLANKDGRFFLCQDGDDGVSLECHVDHIEDLITLLKERL